MLNRRLLLKFIILPIGFITMGHAPWGQWQVYRMRHMLLLSVIEDPESYPFSKIIDLHCKYITGHVKKGVSTKFKGNISIITQVENWQGTNRTFEYYRRTLSS